MYGSNRVPATQASILKTSFPVVLVVALTALVMVISGCAGLVGKPSRAPESFTLIGVVSPGAAGVTVTLSGPVSSTRTTDAGGNYSFSGLANGSYTITPSRKGWVFVPPSETMSVDNSNASAPTFSSTQQTYSISGTISPAGNGAGATITLSGSVVASAIADGAGNFSFSGLGNGTYTLTPTHSGFTFSPANQTITINGATVGSANFTATSQAAPTFSLSGTLSPASLTAGAMVQIAGAASATTTSDVSGNYSFTNLSNGTYTVTPSKSGVVFAPTSLGGTINNGNTTGVNFSASAPTFTVSGTLAGAAGGTVTLSGAANASTVADGAGNFSFSGLSNGSYAVTPSKVGLIFTPATKQVAVSGANVTGITFSSAAQTFSISGTATGGGGATITLSGASQASITADTGGNFTFSGLANGAYTVTPTKTGVTFNPASQAVSVNGANLSGVAFTSNVQTYLISGSITGGAGAAVQLSGAGNASVTADGNGNFTFPGLSNGSYSITPTKTSTSFSPATQQVTINNANVTGLTFTSTVLTYSISGSITGAPGATVQLSGAASASTTADGSGNFTFAGFSNGSYTVMPSKTGFTFTPASKTATISNANVTGMNFSASAQTYVIAGSITGGSGATVQLSGAASSSTTADGGGNFSFSGLGNGSYTVTPTKTGVVFTPASQAATISNANVNGIAFTSNVQTYSVSGSIVGGAGATVQLSGNAGTSTTADGSGNFTFNGLSNGNYTVTPSKTGFTFSPANKSVSIANANVSGVSFAATAQTYSISGSISGGAGATVQLSGNASTSITADGSGNFIFNGLSNGNYTVTPSKTGFTFSPTNKSVSIANANVSGVSFAATAQTYSISGSISSGAGATVQLSGNASTSITADGSGNFIFNGLSNGNYTVTPSKSGLVFTPSNKSVTVSNASVSAVTFSAAAQTFTISGQVSPLLGGAGAGVALSGAASASTTADGSGRFSFSGLANGNYALAPSESGYTFSPATQSATINNGNVSGVNFTATPSAATFTISGNISPAATGSGSLVTLSGATSASTTADANGNFSFSALGNGAYSITPTSQAATFSPASQSVTVNNGNVTGVSFTANATSNVVFFDDFNGSSLSPDWVALNRHGDYSNDEVQCYLPANAAVTGGSLDILSKVQTQTCGDSTHSASSWNYTSSMVQWKTFNFTYGTVEFRAKMAGGQGSWPAIWLLGANCQASNVISADNVGACNWPNPGSDEIDMAEFSNYAADHFSSVSHHLFRSTGNGSCSQNMPNGADASQGFHVYTMTWTSSSVTFSIDGVAANCGGDPAYTSHVPNTPMFLMINNALGGGGCPNGGNCPNNSDYPQTMQVDYVKVTKP